MNDLFSILIIIGIFLTFTPQQVRIVKKGSSLGISPHFMLLGVTSVIAQLLNIVILQIPVFNECREGSPTCFSDILGILQVSVLTVSLALNWCLFLVYYPKPLNASTEGREVSMCVKMFYAFLIGCVLLIAPTFAIAGKDAPFTRGLGQFFGILCTVLSCIQYLPQIYRTWVTKHVGALSATTLAIQAPGSFFFAYTLAMRPATDITTWGSFFISGTFQVTLVALCVYLKKAGYEDEGEGAPLMRDPNDHLENLENERARIFSRL